MLAGEASLTLWTNLSNFEAATIPDENVNGHLAAWESGRRFVWGGQRLDGKCSRRKGSAGKSDSLSEVVKQCGQIAERFHGAERRANRRCAALSRSVQRPKGARLSAMLGFVVLLEFGTWFTL